MPQLNPAPWFTILVFSWMIFMTVLPPKMLKHLFISPPTTLNTKNPKTQPWNWP